MKTILLVEDDDSHAELITRAFRQNRAAYTLVHIHTCAEAHKFLSENPPDLILSDYRLPDGDGTELVDAALNRCPVVIMTSFGDEQLAVQVIKAGALDYLVKMPEAFAQMPRTVERALREWDLLLEKEKADKRIRELLTEKETLVRDAHQRIKNNMTTIEALLSLQADTLPPSAEENVLRNAAGRVRGIALLYEQLYRGDDFSRLSLEKYLAPLIDDITFRFADRTDIRVEHSIDKIELSSNTLSDIGIIINELLTNAFRHAYPENTGGLIRITTSLSSDTLVITVEDNGTGLPTDTIETVTSDPGTAAANPATATVPGASAAVPAAAANPSPLPTPAPVPGASAAALGTVPAAALKPGPGSVPAAAAAPCAAPATAPNPVTATANQNSGPAAGPAPITSLAFASGFGLKLAAMLAEHAGISLRFETSAGTKGIIQLKLDTPSDKTETSP